MDTHELEKKYQFMIATYVSMLRRGDVSPVRSARYILEHCPSARVQMPDSAELSLKNFGHVFGNILAENIKINIYVLAEALNCVLDLSEKLLKLDMLTTFAKSAEGRIDYSAIFKSCSADVRRMVGQGDFDEKLLLKSAAQLRIAEATLETLVSEGLAYKSGDSSWTMNDTGENAHKTLCYELYPLFTSRQPG